MDSLLATYASSDEEDQQAPPPQPSSKPSISLFSSLPKPQSCSSFSSLPKPQSSSEIPKQEYPPICCSNSSSLFSSLPPPKSETTPDIPLPPPKSKRVVQFRPPVPQPSSRFDDDDDDDKEDEEEKERKKKTQVVHDTSVKSFLSSMPTPKSSGHSSLGALPSSLGSGRRSIIETEGPTSASLSSDVNGVNGEVGVGNNQDNLVNSYEEVGGGAGDQGYANYGGYDAYGGYGQYDSSTWSAGESAATTSLGARLGGKRRKDQAPMDFVEVKQDELMKNRPTQDKSNLTGIAFGPAYQAITTWYQSRTLLGDRDAALFQGLQALEARSLAFEEKFKEMADRACMNIDRVFDKAISALKSKRELHSEELEEEEESPKLEEEEEGQRCNEGNSVTTKLSVGKAEEVNEKMQLESGKKEVACPDKYGGWLSGLTTSTGRGWGFVKSEAATSGSGGRGGGTLGDKTIICGGRRRGRKGFSAGGSDASGSGGGPGGVCGGGGSGGGLGFRVRGGGHVNQRSSTKNLAGGVAGAGDFEGGRSENSGAAGGFGGGSIWRHGELEGDSVDGCLNQRKKEFAKGRSAASGSGGGPGDFSGDVTADGSTGGGHDDEERYCLMKLPEEVEYGESLNEGNVEWEKEKRLVKIIKGKSVICHHNCNWAVDITCRPLFSFQALNLTLQGKEKVKLRYVQPNFLTTHPPLILEKYFSTSQLTYPSSPNSKESVQYFYFHFSTFEPTTPPSCTPNFLILSPSPTCTPFYNSHPNSPTRHIQPNNSNSTQTSSLYNHFHCFISTPLIDIRDFTNKEKHCKTKQCPYLDCGCQCKLIHSCQSRKSSANYYPP